MLTPFLMLLSMSALADEQRVYSVDAYGNVQYGKPSYSVGDDGRIVQVDGYGTEQPQKAQLVIEAKPSGILCGNAHLRRLDSGGCQTLRSGARGRTNKETHTFQGKREDPMAR